jgi:acetyltransferase-like isoleucine patch superfamily enzyme
MIPFKFSQITWYIARAIRQNMILMYIRTFGSCSYKSVGKNTVFDGIPDLVVPYSNIYVGRNSRIGKNCVIYTSRTSNIFIGNFVSINNGVHISAQDSIHIGDYTLIAEGVGIRDHDHCFASLHKPIREQGFISKKIVINSNVWIGRNASILKGVTIGEGSVIGANSVVTKDIPPFSINAGNPARVLRFRHDFV